VMCFMVFSSFVSVGEIPLPASGRTGFSLNGCMIIDIHISIVKWKKVGDVFFSGVPLLGCPIVLRQGVSLAQVNPNLMKGVFEFPSP